MCIVGGKVEKPFVKGSSKPKEEPCLNDLIKKMITPYLVYKNNNKEIEVVKISELFISRIEKASVILMDEAFNYSFEGNAQLGIKAPDGIVFSLKSIYGYVYVEGLQPQKICNVIEIK